MALEGGGGDQADPAALPRLLPGLGPLASRRDSWAPGVLRGADRQRVCLHVLQRLGYGEASDGHRIGTACSSPSLQIVEAVLPKKLT